MNIRGYCCHADGRRCVMCPRATVPDMNAGMRDSDAPPPMPDQAPPLEHSTLEGKDDFPPDDPTVDTGAPKATQDDLPCYRKMTTGRR